MRQRHLLRLALSLFLLLVLAASDVAAETWSDTDVFIDVDGAAAAIDDGATVVDGREQSDFRRAHIPSASRISWQDLVDGDRDGALVDDDEVLSERLQEAGISHDQPVIVYGGWANDGAWGEEGRLFWTLEYLGHQDVQILEGGLSAWRDAAQEISRLTSSSPDRGDFEVQRQTSRRASTDAIAQSLPDSSIQLIDTREPGEYRGEPKYGEERGGHIPSAIHLWWRQLFDDDGQLHSPEQIHALLEAQDIDLDEPIAAYCTGGIRSGFVYAVLRALGADQPMNYDASMWEWTAQSELPLSTP